jgi:hypothetical protein
MRKKNGDAVDSTPRGAHKRDKRGISTMSKKIDNVLQSMILPLSGQIATLPPHTVFRLTEYDCLCNILADSISKDCPTLSKHRASMLQAMDRAYTHVFATP